MNTYVIFEQVTDTNRQYVNQIYRVSIYTGSDIGDAIEFNSIEEAKIVCDLIKRRNKTKTYKILEIVTTQNIIE